MSRLTIEKRKQIVKAESDLKFNEDFEKAKTDFQKECEAIVKKGSPKVPAALEAYVSYKNSIELSICGSEQKKYGVRLINLPNSYPCKNYSHKIEFKGRVKQKAEKIKKIKEERSEFESKLRSSISQFTTVKKLLDAIPELGHHFVGGANGNLPMVIVDVAPIRRELKKLHPKKKSA
jgi:hypothetical protein